MVSVPGKVPPVCADPQTRPGAATAGLERAAPGGWASRWSAPGGHPPSRPAGCSPRPRHGVKGREGAGMCRQERPFPRKEPSARGRGVPPVPPPSSLQDALPSTGAAPGPAASGRTPATQASGRGGEVAAARGCHPGTPPRVPTDLGATAAQRSSGGGGRPSLTVCARRPAIPGPVLEGNPRFQTANDISQDHQLSLHGGRWGHRPDAGHGQPRGPTLRATGRPPYVMSFCISILKSQLCISQSFD